MSIRNGMQEPTEAERARVRKCIREHRPFWMVTIRKANYSAFNGYHYTPSDYSEVTCTEPSCNRRWRTKAAYVDQLP